MHPLRTGAEKLPGLSRDLPIVNLHKTRKTQSYQLVHIHKICKQDFALSSPLAQFNQHKSCLRPLFHLHSHLFITFPSGNQGIHSKIANIHWTRLEPQKKRESPCQKKSSTLLDQNLGPCVDCAKRGGACLSLSELARFGEVLGKRAKWWTSAGGRKCKLWC